MNHHRGPKLAGVTVIDSVTEMEKQGSRSNTNHFGMGGGGTGF